MEENGNISFKIYSRTGVEPRTFHEVFFFFFKENDRFFHSNYVPKYQTQMRCEMIICADMGGGELCTLSIFQA